MILGIFAILAFIGWKAYNCETVKLYNSVKKWERIEANVLHKKIVVYDKKSETSKTRYVAKLEYEYKYNKVIYKSNSLILLN